MTRLVNSQRHFISRLF